MPSTPLAIRLCGLLFFLWTQMCVAAQSTSLQKPLVVATASIFADMAHAIGDTLIEVASIVPIGGDPHIYEPTPGDVRLLVKANLILQNGLTFEGWIQDLIRNSGSQAPVVTITEGVEPITSTQYQNATDPHAWMDPLFGKIYAFNIKESLIHLIPEHRDQITAQYDSYIQQLEELDRYITNQISTIDSAKRILITSHDAFHYFGQRYGLRLESVLGTSTDADVRTSDIMRLNQVIQEFKIPVIFVESTINPKLLKQIAADNKISIGGTLYSDSLGDKDSPADTYLRMIRHNTDVIVKGLTTEPGATTPVKTKSPLILLLSGAGLFMIMLGIWWIRKKSKAK